MRLFGVGPIPIFLCRKPSGPTPPTLKDFDVFYTDQPILGVDVMPTCDIDTQCAFYVEQYLCDFGSVGFTACDEQSMDSVSFQCLNIIPEGPAVVGVEIL